VKILVTGSNGLLGQKLVFLLNQDKEIDLVATSRRENRSGISNENYRSLDITNVLEVEKVISETKPDVVINTAAMTQVDQCETDREACWLANVTAVDHLIKACSKTNAHLIHVSTDFIFDGTHGPLDESAVPNPVNYYGESKLAAEKAIMNSTISWCILRTVLVFGITNDQSRSNIVLWVKKNLEEGKPIRVVNDQWRTPTLAEDLAQGCYLAAIKKSRGIYHISGEEMMTPYDIAMATAGFFKLDKSLITSTDSTLFKQPAKRPAKTGFDISNAKRELGYAPHNFQEGLSILAKQLNE
jgi:dTDP-4-dehydrorhamnose reductase